MVALSLTVVLVSCNREAPNQPENAIARETFIDVFVELRSIALRKTSRTVNPAERDSILAMHAASQEDMQFFLEAYRNDADFMRDLWNDVEERMIVLLEVQAEGS